MNNNRYIIDCDFHTHTGFSDDCDVSVEEMLKSAADQGIRTLAVTDHYDPGYPDPEFPFTIDFKKYQETMLKAREEYKGTMDIMIAVSYTHLDVYKRQSWCCSIIAAMVLVTPIP